MTYEPPLKRPGDPADATGAAGASLIHLEAKSGPMQRLVEAARLATDAAGVLASFEGLSTCLRDLTSGQLTASAAAEQIGLERRQVQRLATAYQDQGATALIPRSVADRVTGRRR